MFRKLRPRSLYDVMAALGFFIALATGSAYAANTVFSADIVDGQVKTADLANGAATSDKLGDGSITGDKVKDGSIQGRDVLDNNLKGADIDESTLSGIGGGGPAGGDLTGTYPNPSIKPNAVTGDEIANGSLTGDDLSSSVPLPRAMAVFSGYVHFRYQLSARVQSRRHRPDPSEFGQILPRGRELGGNDHRPGNGSDNGEAGGQRVLGRRFARQHLW